MNGFRDLVGWTNPGGINEGFGRDINSLGQIVGYGIVSSSTRRAAMWDWNAPSVILDLNSMLNAPLDPGYSLMEAVGVNDSGQILCLANREGFDVDRAYLLSPVPEPSGYVLTAIALAAIRLAPRRDRRSRCNDARSATNGRTIPAARPTVAALWGMRCDRRPCRGLLVTTL
jgi:hypothetical protein